MSGPSDFFNSNRRQSIQLVRWREMAKDKRFESQLKKEAKAQGYGSDVNRYLNDLLTIEKTDDGRLLARARRESVIDLPDLESTHELSRAEQDKADVISFDTSDFGGTEPVTQTAGSTPAAKPRQPILPLKPSPLHDLERAKLRRLFRGVSNPL
ncbi:hypothetical protein [Endozoicomonas sp. ONNA2]|uniref:hypothetical protein n=1 Tax=Endozoicomonas sp. ONNA2 TaxID=2828741 RepID=UPI002147F416|nr:hypothetical protein [Endozoicomonas sp. ONNA2]